MEFLEKQLADATKESQTNAHASKCLSDMMEAGYLKHDNDGNVTIVNPD